MYNTNKEPLGTVAMYLVSRYTRETCHFVNMQYGIVVVQFILFGWGIQSQIVCHIEKKQLGV